MNNSNYHAWTHTHAYKHEHVHKDVIHNIQFFQFLNFLTSYMLGIYQHITWTEHRKQFKPPLTNHHCIPIQNLIITFPVVRKLYNCSWYVDSPQYCSVVAGTLFVAGDHFLRPCPQTWLCPHASAIPAVPTDCCLHWIFVLTPQTVPPNNTSTCLKTVWL